VTLHARQTALCSGSGSQRILGVVEDLRPLLHLPVELVLPAHGVATDRAAFERALS
jgi:hypothetical protein